MLYTVYSLREDIKHMTDRHYIGNFSTGRDSRGDFIRRFTPVTTQVKDLIRCFQYLGLVGRATIDAHGCNVENRAHPVEVGVHLQ